MASLTFSPAIRADLVGGATRGISVRGLTKSFGALSVLQGIDLEVARGENLVVLGRSGGGKSVLIKLVSGLLRPDAGSVTVLGERVDQLDGDGLQALRRKMGFLFQGSALYDSMDVRHNLAFPLVRNVRDLSSAEVAQRVDEALDEVGLRDAGSRMPSALSGGQRKRIGIARTLIMRPEIMLYDEPTAGLDPITSAEINELIRDVRTRYHTTSIIITHDLACAKTTGDRIVLLHEGRLAAEGTFDEVFASRIESVRGFHDYNFLR
jgi:phospholipid/cholesterol/gamma-HCH transport system ATP-binding protein